MLITGAARGIGAAIAYRFAQEGSRLIVSDSDEAGVQHVAAGKWAVRGMTKVAEAAVFLASDESRYMTGSEVVIDGGVSA